MVKLKYAPGVTPLVNEHHGYTFQSGRIGQTAMYSQKNDRSRNVRQINRKYNLMQAVTNWRNMSPTTKSNWDNFAATYPVPCKNPDQGFLSGYQLFIKRHQYLFLNYDINTNFMETPSLTEVVPVNPNFEIKLINDRLLCFPNFNSNPKNLIYSIYLSFRKSSGRCYQNSETRYCGFFKEANIPANPIGDLYNYYAITDQRNMCPTGYHMPTDTEWNALINFTGGLPDYFDNEYICGGRLKQIGLTNWRTPNSGATDTFAFSAVGYGYRAKLGTRNQPGTQSAFASLPSGESEFQSGIRAVYYNGTYIGRGSKLEPPDFGQFNFGLVVRPIKDDSNNLGFAIGNDGKYYPTHKINNQVWITVNSSESLFRNGDIIPVVEPNLAWSLLTSAGKCSAIANYVPPISASFNNPLDITALYKLNFGILPSAGDNLLFKAIPYSSSNGQFFSQIKQVLTVI